MLGFHCSCTCFYCIKLGGEVLTNAVVVLTLFIGALLYCFKSIDIFIVLRLDLRCPLMLLFHLRTDIAMFWRYGGIYKALLNRFKKYCFFFILLYWDWELGIDQCYVCTSMLMFSIIYFEAHVKVSDNAMTPCLFILLYYYHLCINAFIGVLPNGF